MEVHQISENEPSTSNAIICSQKSESSVDLPSSLMTNSSSDFAHEVPIPTASLKMNVITPEVVAALVQANVSSRNATFIIAAVLSSVGVKIENTTLSYRTIQRTRIILRRDIAQELKDEFKFHDKYTVHWDGKMLEDITGPETVVDRLPIILTAFGAEQLLGVPKIDSGTGSNQPSAILATLNEWGVSRYVKAMCFDTASVNTGVINGTRAAIEKALERKLIYLPCCHHIFELILKSAFEVYWPVKSGPNVPMFGRFKSSWNRINKLKYKTGIEDTIVTDNLLESKDELSGFITQHLQVLQTRDDYKEFLELSLIFLGEMPNRILFNKHGAVHTSC